LEEGGGKQKNQFIVGEGSSVKRQWTGGLCQKKKVLVFKNTINTGSQAGNKVKDKGRRQDSATTMGTIKHGAAGEEKKIIWGWEGSGNRG